MGDVTPALGAIAAIVSGVVYLARRVPRIRKLFRIDQGELVANLRERAELYEAKYELVMVDLAAERLAHGATRDALLDEQRAGDRCRRELDSVQSELRAISRRRQPGGRQA